MGIPYRDFPEGILDEVSDFLDESLKAYQGESLEKSLEKSPEKSRVFLEKITYHLSPIANEFVGSYQAGFIDGRSTTDQIFSVRQILQKCREYQVPTHHLFIDFKAAYDSIDRVELWKIMDENSFPGKLIKIDQSNDGRCAKLREDLGRTLQFARVSTGTTTGRRTFVPVVQYCA